MGCSTNHLGEDVGRSLQDQLDLLAEFFGQRKGSVIAATDGWGLGVLFGVCYKSVEDSRI